MPRKVAAIYCWAVIVLAFTRVRDTRAAVQPVAAESETGFVGNVDYLYSYESSVNLLRNVNLTVHGDVLVRAISGFEEEGVELLVSFRDFSLTWETDRGSHVDHSGFGDLSQWFSIVKGRDGSITKVLHPANELGTITALKKSIAALFSIGTEDNERELTGSGVTVRVESTTVHSSQEKTTSKVSSLDRHGLLLSVEVQETVKGTPAKGEALLTYPIHAHSTLSLTRQTDAPTGEAPERPLDLVSDGVEIGEPQVETIPLARIQPQLTAKIACAASSSSCRVELVSLLRALSDEDMSDLAMQQFEPGASPQDALVFIDALSQLRRTISGELLTQFVLRPPATSDREELVLRVLLHATTAAVTPNREMVSVIEELVFSGDATSSIQHQGLLALGSIARQLKPSDQQLAGDIRHTLHAALEHLTEGAGQHFYTKSKRSTFPSQYDSLLHSVLVDSLGNARDGASLPTLVGHMTDAESTPTKLNVKHAAVRAVSQYDSEESASALLRAAESSPYPSVRHVAAKAYQSHPRRKRDITVPDLPRSSSPSRTRRQLASPDGLVSQVVMPPVSWNAVYGEENISTSIHRTVMNSFEIETASLSSIYKFSLHDDTSFAAHMLLSDGEHTNEMLRTEFCLEGEASYDVRILNDFTQDLISHQFDRLSLAVDPLIREFEAAYDEIVASEVAYNDLDQAVHQSLEELPDKFGEILALLDEFLTRTDGIESSFELKTMAQNAFAQINSSFVDTYEQAQNPQQAISAATDDIIPSKPQAVVSSLLASDGQPFTNAYLPFLRYAPQMTLTNILAIYRSTGDSFAELESSVSTFQRLTDPYGPSSPWLSPALGLRTVKDDLRYLLVEISEAIDMADKSLTQSYDGATMEELLSLEVAVTDYLQPALFSLEQVAVGVLSSAAQVNDAFSATATGFDNLGKAYDTARGEVDTIFGQRFHLDFPRRMRSCNLTSCGTYPTTSHGMYRAGVDLQTDDGTQVMTPISGYVQLLDPDNITNSSNYSYDATNTILITPEESSLSGLHFVISNIIANPSSVNMEPQYLAAGAPIALPDTTRQLSGQTFIHVEAYKILDGVEYAIDPSQFLQPVLDPTVSTVFECNDFVTHVGGVVVERKLVSPVEPELELVGSPLVVGIPDHEFPQPHELVLRAEESMTSAGTVQFFQASTFLMVGAIPVQFEFGSVGQYQLNYSVEAGLLSQETEVTVTPYLHARADGTMKVGSTTFALVELGGSLVETSLPLTLTQDFHSWPLVASSSMDVVLAPTTLNLTTQLVQLTGAGEFADQEVLEAEVLWEYSIPPLNRDEFYYEGKLEDTSAPTFYPLSYANESQCFIRQLPWRTYTNPAFELELGVSDPQGSVNVAYKVGSFIGGGDVIPETELGGKRVVVPHELVPMATLFLTLSATNLNELESFATCQLPVYDRSPPLARINPIRSVSSHPSRIKALVSLFDEYGFTDVQEIAIGSVPGEYGYDVLPWTAFAIAGIYSPPDLDGDIMNLFSFARSGKLQGAILSTISADNINVEECATQCADMDTCHSFDFSRFEGTCILHSNIEGPATPTDSDYENNFSTPPLQPSVSYSHYEKLGVGNSAEVDYTGLTFEHNKVYYINMRLTNSLGYTNIVSSSGFVVDMVPPLPGKIRNAVSDMMEMGGCTASLIRPDCIDESGQYNHRVIIDGPGSATVFNGPIPLLDAMYTSTTNYIAANWNGFRDPESGLYAYTWCVGTSLQTCDLLPPQDPHGHLNSQQYWTNSGLETSIQLSNGSYFITIQAVSAVEYGGPLVTTVHHSTPFIVDVSPASLGVQVLAYNTSSNLLLLAYNSSDPQSGISSVSVALGRSSLDTSLMPWTDVEAGSGYNEVVLSAEIPDVEAGSGYNEVVLSAEIPDGVPTWVKVRATNNAGLDTIAVATNSPVIVDRTPPVAGEVWDGVEGEGDLAYQPDTATLCVNIRGFDDPESGLGEVLWGVGTARGQSNIRSLTAVNETEYVGMRSLCDSSLSLVDNTTYYSTVVVSNGAVSSLSVTVTSSGVHTDTSPPLAGSVMDGFDPQDDQQFSNSLTTVSVNWKDFADYESGIAHYTITIFLKLSGSAEAFQLHRETVEGSTTEFTRNHFTFSDGDNVLVELEASNGAGLLTAVNSSGYTIDLSAPQLQYLVDGLDVSEDMDYQSVTDTLSAIWQASDSQSGIQQVEGAVFELRDGQRVRVHPDPFFTDATTEPVVSTNWIVSDLTLHPGRMYVVALTFTNGAGLRSQYETNGVIIDTTPPVVDLVSVQSDTYIDPDATGTQSIDIIANPDQVEARWMATDPESGVLEYHVGVVDENSTLVVPEYIDFGRVTGGRIENLGLTPGQEYQVAVIAVNRAGLMSEPRLSDRFRVSVGDSSGTVYDGDRTGSLDLDFTDETTAITMHFDGFSSQSCGGIARYEWAVGVGEEESELILPFTEQGIVVTGTGGRGYAQLPLPDLASYAGQMLYVTVRGITGCDEILQSSSNGFVIDTSPLSIGIIGVGSQAVEHAQAGGTASTDRPTNHEEYQSTSTYSAIWSVEDEDGGLTVATSLRVGTYPGGEDVESETAVASENYVRGSLGPEGGLPNYITVLAENEAGLETSATSEPIVLDTTPPTGGQVSCKARGYPEPTLLWTSEAGADRHGVISCEWLEVGDAESGILQYVVSIGTTATDQSVLSETSLEGNSNVFVSPLLTISDATPYYVTIRIINGARLETILTSDPVYFDVTPPLVSEAFIAILPNSLASDYNMSNFDTEPVFLSDSVICLLDTDIVTVVFQDSTDEETDISRYEIGVGYFPGNDDVLSYQIFDPLISDGFGYYILYPIDFSDAGRQGVYFSVKLCNNANICSLISSLHTFVKSSSSSRSSWVYDGENPTSDIDYQTSTTSTFGHFSVGTNCPLQEARWAIESTDGELVQDYVDIPVPGTSGNYVDNVFALSTDQIRLHDDETYRILVQATDLTGEVHILRSNGTAVTTRSLVPGLVQDGPISGQDLNYQESTSTLHAHWSGFGDGSPEQEIVYYEVAAGSDREYVSTRTDIAAFTNVGLNTSHVFTNLELITEDIVYYITVRAHAISGAYTDSTSNGIRSGYGHAIIPGSITVPLYQQDTTTISTYWTAFESDLPIRSYEWAVGYRYLRADELDMLCQDTELDYAENFEVFGLRFVDLDTSATASGLALEHNTTYYVTVRAVDEAQKCIATTSSGLLIDTTAPEPRSFIAVGPEESTINIPGGADYTIHLKPQEDLLVSWEPFIDHESGIRGYEIAIFEQIACGNTTHLDMTPLRDFTDISDATSVTLEDLHFSNGVPYVVQVRATNDVSLSSSLFSPPLILDSSDLIVGSVKDGLNWESDTVFQSTLNSLSGVIAHAKLAADLGGMENQDTPCPQTAFYNLSQFDDNWDRFVPSNIFGLVTNALSYDPISVDLSSEPLGLSIMATTDGVTPDNIISGAYQTQADISQGGTVSLDILPAMGTPVFQENAVTSVVFIDSGNDSTVLADFEIDLADGIDYLSLFRFSAFGLQIHRGYSNETEDIPPRVILWSKSEYSLAPPVYISTDITGYNLSDVHSFKLEFTSEQLDVDYSRRVDLYIDDSLVSSLHNLPSFSVKTRLILHIFNRLGYVPETDGFNPPTVQAIFANVTLPMTVSHICDFGMPFYNHESPVVEFLAGVGTTPGTWDVAGPEVISFPCRPCIPGACVEFACNRSCTDIDPYLIPFTFHNLSLLPGYYTNLNQSDTRNMEFELANENQENTMFSLLSNYFQPSVYYLTVQAVTASGQTATSSSNGVTIDISPPELASPIEHFDVSFPQMEATRFQGSESTVSARWRFSDSESGVVEYSWAIGTYPFGQDIQSFEPTGTATEATNPSLLGILKANTTYYVTVSATNGAGLTRNATSGGVTVITEELNLTALETFVEVQAIGLLTVPGENGTETEVWRNDQEDRVSITWEGISNDVVEIFWQIGSEKLTDDIIPRTEVSFNNSRSATVLSGVLFIGGEPFANMSEVIALAEGKVEDPADNELYLEPGRLYYNSLEMCNFVHRCVIAETEPSIVIRSKDFEVRSGNGGDRVITAYQSGPVGMEAPVLDREHTVIVTTTGGLERGSRVFVGLLNSSDLSRRYRVNTPYIVDPYLTMSQTSREIARRFTDIGGPSFYVSFLGQNNLYDTLEVNVTFDPTLDWTVATPELAYWDIDEEVWREVSATCRNDSVIDWSTYTISAQVCSTALTGSDTRPTSLTRRRRQASSGIGSGLDEDMNEIEFLDRPTHFIVISIGNQSTNTAPELQLPTGPLVVTEDDGAVQFQLLFTDGEEDNVEFHLASVPRIGNASLSSSGLLTYTPCANCIGTDTIEIYIVEVLADDINTTPLSASGQLQIEIQNTNDVPQIFLYSPNSTTDSDIVESLRINAYTEANRTAPTVIARIAGFDFDGYEDDLTIFIRGGGNGDPGYQMTLDAVNTPESLPVNWFPDDPVTAFTGYITFIAAEITYLPFDTDFVGTDEIEIVLRDTQGSFSAFLTVEVQVLPSLCQNGGVCGGSDADPDCLDVEARKNRIIDYNCSCPSDYGGQFCDVQLTTPEPQPDRGCLDGVPIVECDGDPCDGAVCPSHMEAECRSNYCGACTAEWFVGDTPVHCSADSPNICHQPVNTAAIVPCVPVTCDCPAQPYSCPEDSVFVEVRHSDCCVTYECICPNISCPILMESSQKVQPIPNYRGNGFPGRCCPDYGFEDIDECGQRADNLCTDICVNEEYIYSCTCPSDTTLAQDGAHCGVCPYNGMEYLLGDRVKIGCNWCICQGDDLSGERWHCTARSCDRGCVHDGMFYPLGSVLASSDTTLSCSCVPTDADAEWSCTLE